MGYKLYQWSYHAIHVKSHTANKCKRVQKKQGKFLEWFGSEAGVPVRRCQPGSRGSPGVCHRHLLPTTCYCQHKQAQIHVQVTGHRHRTTYYFLVQAQSTMYIVNALGQAPSRALETPNEQNLHFASRWTCAMCIDFIEGPPPSLPYNN